MSEFISGNVGMVRKEDIFCLELKGPDFLTSKYEIQATYYKDDVLQMIVLDRRRNFTDVSRNFERIKKEIVDDELWKVGRT